jgi:hypothetical protein
LSFAVNVTVTFVLFHVGSALAFVTGAVRSMFTAGLLVAEVVLPARSVTEALRVSKVPSPVMTLSLGQPPGMPEVASLHVQWIVTFPLYQPFPFAAVVGAPASVGGVLSMLRPDTVVDAVFPALSVAVPGTDCPAPSDVNVLVGVQLAMPEPVSPQVKFTATFVLFHPFEFGAGVAAPLIVGGVLSRRYDADPLLLVPVQLASVNAVTVTLFVPSAPEPAVKLNGQLVVFFGIGGSVSEPENAPETVTQLVSLLVTTVRTSGAPVLAAATLKLAIGLPSANAGSGVAASTNAGTNRTVAKIAGA